MKTLTLAHTYKVDGETLTEVAVMEPTARHIEALQNAPKKGTGILNLVADLTCQAPDTIRALQADDYLMLQDVVMAFFPKGLLTSEE